MESAFCSNFGGSETEISRLREITLMKLMYLRFHPFILSSFIRITRTGPLLPVKGILQILRDMIGCGSSMLQIPH